MARNFISSLFCTSWREICHFTAPKPLKLESVIEKIATVSAAGKPTFHYFAALVCWGRGYTCSWQDGRKRTETRSKADPGDPGAVVRSGRESK